MKSDTFPAEPGFAREGPSGCTGHQLNRYGNFYGRTFLKTCNQLVVALRDRCGEGKDFQVNDEGWLVWVGAGNSPKDITGTCGRPRCVLAIPPWGVELVWGHPIVDRPLAGQPGQGVGINSVIGSALPKFRFTISNDMSYKRLTVYALLDATIGHLVNNQSEQWGLLSQAPITSTRPIILSKPPSRPGTPGGQAPPKARKRRVLRHLNPNNRVLEDVPYAKLREVAVNFRVGRIAGVGDWTLGVIGRNLYTFAGTRTRSGGRNQRRQRHPGHRVRAHQSDRRVRLPDASDLHVQPVHALLGAVLNASNFDSMWRSGGAVSLGACELEVINPNSPTTIQIKLTPADWRISGYPVPALAQCCARTTANIWGMANVMPRSRTSPRSRITAKGSGSAFRAPAMTTQSETPCGPEQARVYNQASEAARSVSDVLPASTRVSPSAPRPRPPGRSFAEFIRGLSLGYIAMVYDSASIIRPDDPLLRYRGAG